MEITEIRIKLVESGDKLRAFCSITIDDCFVIRDLKIIDGTKGAFVAMPSRKLTSRCRCGCKNYTRAKFCNDCGSKIPRGRSDEDDGRGKQHADIAHPINSQCREELQSQVLDEFYAECKRSEESGSDSQDPDSKATDPHRDESGSSGRDDFEEEEEYVEDDGEEEYEEEEKEEEEEEEEEEE